jgi:hypothetical protein
LIRALKPKKCRICARTFAPISSMSKVCSVPCSLEWARRLAAKKVARVQREERKATREALAKLKTRKDHLGELQDVFNTWIRCRDANNACISCERSHRGQWHAGHYQGVGRAPALRFEPDNVHKQCKPCNKDLHGNLIAYRINLIKKIGMERVEWLEGPHPPLKLTLDEILRLKAFYRAEVRRMKKEAA